MWPWGAPRLRRALVALRHADDWRGRAGYPLRSSAHLGQEAIEQYVTHTLIADCRAAAPGDEELAAQRLGQGLARYHLVAPFWGLAVLNGGAPEQRPAPCLSADLHDGPPLFASGQPALAPRRPGATERRLSHLPDWR